MMKAGLWIVAIQGSVFWFFYVLKGIDKVCVKSYNNLRIILKFERGGVCGTLSDRTKEKINRVHDPKL